MSIPVAVVPAIDVIIEAAKAGGAELVEPEHADALIWMDPLDPEHLRRVLPSCPARWVQLPLAGVEKWAEADLLDPTRTWTCAKAAYGPTVAEQILASILLAARRMHRHARARTWMGWDERGLHKRLDGSTALLVGTGYIGSSLVPMLQPLGVRIVAVNRSGSPMPGAERTVTVEHLLEVLPEADWVVLTPPLTQQTHGMFGAAELAAMRPDAWLINVARGQVVHADALVEALQAGRIGGAVLDVTDPEPLPDDHPLWSMDRCVITSHTGNTWEMAVPELANLVRRNVAHFAAGEPLEGVVDLSLGY